MMDQREPPHPNPLPRGEGTGPAAQHHPQSVREAATRHPRVGIIWRGSARRMTAEAASQLGVEIFVLEREANSPAGQIVGPDHEIVGDWHDRDTQGRWRSGATSSPWKTSSSTRTLSAGW